MIVLGIETSCDETAAAIVKSGGEVLSNKVFSQVDMHAPYGGVVPEIASRSHVEVLPGLIDEALKEANLDYSDLDGIAATYGPGLSSSLLVGLSSAKALSIRLKKPFIAVNHLEGHIYSVFLKPETLTIEEACPFVSLVVSGGHTCLVRVEGIGKYTLLSQTIDDAAGEAFDKGAKLLGLGYPGGPIMDREARNGKSDFFRFPRARPTVDSAAVQGLDPSLCFSFSGLKTSLLYYLKKNPISPSKDELSSVIASYQEAIVEVLVERSKMLMRKDEYFSVCGGVSLNSSLRARLEVAAGEVGARLLKAEPKYCGDNAAMIAGLAVAGGGIAGEAAFAQDVDPNVSF